MLPEDNRHPVPYETHTYKLENVCLLNTPPATDPMHKYATKENIFILQLSSLLLAVTQEIPKLARIDMMLYVDEESFTEFKSTRKLFH